MTNEPEQPYNWGEDKDWLAELDRREQALLNGTAIVYTLEESMERIMKSIKANKQKKSSA